MASILMVALFASLYAFEAAGQSACTTLQPVFVPIQSDTTTVFASTAISTSSLDCGGCSLTVRTFGTEVPTAPSVKLITCTEPTTTSTSYVCLPSTVTASFPSIPVTRIPATPTASPLPPISDTAQSFIDELSAALLYVQLIANGGNGAASICSAINTLALDNITNPAINGTAVQNEICSLGVIQVSDPSLADLVAIENQEGVTYLATALYAVQVAGGYAGGPNLAKLCSEIEAEFIDRLFIGYVPNAGTQVKDYVCAAASATSGPTGTSPPYPVNTTCSCP